MTLLNLFSRKMTWSSAILGFSKSLFFEFLFIVFQRRKNKVKEEKAEARKTKIKKHIKKRKEKMQKTNSK